MDGISNTLSDILYPECHLDSPIVTGKLVELVYYTGLPWNQPLEDDTLIRNFRLNAQNHKRSPLIYTQRKYGDRIRFYIGNQTKLNPVPYPNANNSLFRLKSNNISMAFEKIMSYMNTCYRKISPRLINLKKHVTQKISANNILDYHADKKENNSILHLAEIMEGSVWYKSFLFWFTIKKEFRSLVQLSNQPTSRKSDPMFEVVDDDLIVIINRHLCSIIQRKTWEIYYLTFEMVLMMSDVLEGRLMIDTCMRADPRYTSLVSRGELLWDFIDSLFIDLGNATYDIVASIEPLVLGYLQLNDPSPLLRGAFLDYCLRDLVAVLKDQGYDDESDIDGFLTMIDQIFNIPDIHLTAEYFSFFRTFGHPTLEAQNAAKKVRQFMNKPKLLRFKTLMKGHAIFCGIIINGYRDRHGGSWPPCRLPDHASREIISRRNNGEGLTEEVCIQNWKSFVGFHFECFMSISLDEDLTMYMKDKALSPIKSEWDCVYPRVIMPYNPPNSTSSRRLVEVFLDDSNFDPYILINYVLSGDYLRDPDFNISYSLKEKEIKQVGRLFAKMTYKMRACQVVAESLIANGIGKYFKENGMSKDEHELLKTLHKLSASAVPRNNKKGFIPDKHKSLKSRMNSKKRKEVRFAAKTEDIQYETVSTFLTTDLQKFCLNWRQESTNLFAERLNEAYGLPGFFNWQHKILEKSTLYVSDPHCPPYNIEHIELDQVENDQIFIKYPMGGIEGYSQKLWTITTIPFLFLSAYEIGAKIAAVVQGDNQAIAITKRVHPNLPYVHKKNLSAEVAQEYFYRLRENLWDIGHNLKANETIISSNFFVYSKRIYYDGLVLSQSLKPLSRVVFWSETIVDETRSACSNISTAIAKGIEQGYSRWLGYALNCLKTTQQLGISLKFTINKTMTPDISEPIYNNPYWLLSASLVPAQIGGFNYLNISRLYVRNIGDPVTASFADIKRLIRSSLLTSKLLQKIMHQQPGNSTYLDWASDPYSINIPHTQSVTTVLKNITARVILQNSQNPMLRGLFHEDFEKEDADLAEFLLNRPIIIPRAAHEIMDKSLTGARQEIAGMLDTTKGLIKNSLRVGGIRPALVYRLAGYDYEQFKVFNALMLVNNEDPLISVDTCSVELAINLRKRMWRDLAHGRKIYGLEVPDVVEVCDGYFITNCEDCYYCTAGSQEYGWFFCPAECELDRVTHESNTLRVPYFGSTTDERSEIKLSNVRSPSRALKSAIRIATVYTWAYGDSDQSWEEAWYLSSFRANVTFDELKAITPISTSNNIAHRLRDRSTQMKYASTSLNRAGRYVTISNDKLNFIIDEKKVDTNLVYQQIMLIGLSIIEDKFRFVNSTGEYNTVLHLHIRKSCCIREMIDHPYIDSMIPVPTLRSLTSNKLIYDDEPIIEKTRNVIMQQVYKSGVLEFPMWDIRDLNVGLAQSLSITIVEIISKENRDHLAEFKTLENTDDINSMITEFLLVDPEEFSLYLGLACAINWAYDIYYRRPEGKYQMIEYLSTVLITSSRSLMAVLSNALSHPKVFQRFWDCGLIEPIYGSNLSVQDFYAISVNLLTTSYHLYLNRWLEDDGVQYMLTESEEEIVDQRFEIIQSRHLCVLSGLYLHRQDMPQIRGMTAIEKCTVLSGKLEEMKYHQGIYADWNLEPLEVVIYPASLTYIRRGIIKHIRLRSYLSGESIAEDKIQVERRSERIYQIPTGNIMFEDTTSTYFPLTALFSQDFNNIADFQPSRQNPNKWENHIKRRIGINSTSCYKALEISSYIQNLLDSSAPRLFLGEGSGAMMITYYQTFGRAKTYYNTGIYSSDVQGQRVLSLIPSEAMLVVKNNPMEILLELDLVTLFNGKPESTWIGCLESFKYIMESVPHHSLGFIHNDMESSYDKDPTLILQEQIHSLALALNLGHPTSTYVCKLAPRPDDYTSQLFSLYLTCYEHVMCFVPYSSNPYSSEIYIILSYPIVRTIVTPDMLFGKINVKGSITSIKLQDTILNYKIAKHLTKIKEDKCYGDYSKSNLNALTKEEKILLSMGFSVNGPKLVKSLIGHDIASGPETLKAAIQSQYNLLLNTCDETREQNPFFDPYPIRKEARIRELIFLIAKKLSCYFILYCIETNPLVRRNVINQLRRKYLQIDLGADYCKIVAGKYLVEKYKKMRVTGMTTVDLETAEVKIWWKIVGYSLLLSNPD